MEYFRRETDIKEVNLAYMQGQFDIEQVSIKYIDGTLSLTLSRYILMDSETV